MSGLFGTFNIATRGMSVQQKAIDVTSHNVANANTEGYSRQRATMETTRPFGMPTMNSVAEPGQLGTGAQITAISRVRDSFMDYQIRVETSTQGTYNARQNYLSQVESIFNEPSDTGISNLMTKFFDGWQQLSKQPQSSNARTVVAQQSAALADALNHNYTQLQKLKENCQSSIKQGVFDVNNMLNQVNILNKQIVGVKVAGNMPNDLMDKRDLLLDQLSSKFNINLDKKNFEGVDLKPVDTNSINNPNLVEAIDSGNPKRFSYISSITATATPGTYKLIYYKNGDMSTEANKQELTLTGLNEEEVKNIDENRVLWANKDGVAIKADGTPLSETIGLSDLNLFKPSAGELSGYMSIQKDVDGYTDQLNKLAKSLAFTVNTIHSGMSDPTLSDGTTPAKDFNPFFVNSATATYGGNSALSNVDSTLASEYKMTAGNISVNKELISDVMKIKVRTNDNKFATESLNNLDGATDGSRALAIAQLRNTLVKVQDMGGTIKSRKDLFDATKGGNVLTNNGMAISNNTNGMSLDNYFKDTIDKLGVQSQEAKKIVTNQQNLLSSLDQAKESVSGVSVDEEMANLVQFQHAYQANAKVISTIDQLLDVIVNGLKK